MPPGIHTKSRARKKTCPGSLGQLDLFAGQVTIKNDLPPNGQGSSQVILKQSTTTMRKKWPGATTT